MSRRIRQRRIRSKRDTGQGISPPSRNTSNGGAARITWKRLAIHRWVSGATITESIRVDDDRYRRFTATILGWRNWRIYEGRANPDTARKVREKVIEIRDRIEAGDETVFKEPVIIA